MHLLVSELENASWYRTRCWDRWWWPRHMAPECHIQQQFQHNNVEWRIAALCALNIKIIVDAAETRRCISANMCPATTLTVMYSITTAPPLCAACVSNCVLRVWVLLPPLCAACVSIVASIVCCVCEYCCLHCVLRVWVLLPPLCAAVSIVASIVCWQGFRDHVKKDHNMWNYVYYSNYLDSIDTSDHTAIQKYVYELVSTCAIHIPIHHPVGIDFITQKALWWKGILFAIIVPVNVSSTT